MIDNRQFRDALGKFATGICVVTVAPEGGEPLGLTVNSFASVSLDPPLVLWSIQNNSECFDAFSRSQKFAVNILSAEQETHSMRYATRGGHALQAGHYAIGKTGSPRLKGALACLECRVWARYPGGDHQILVGEVEELETRPTGIPLLYHSGSYALIR